MCGDKVLQLADVEFSQQRSRGSVVEVAVKAANTSFERSVVIAMHQHIEVVVAFQHQSLATGKRFRDVRCGSAGVSQHA